MNKKKFLKPTKQKILIAVFLFIIIFLIPYFKLSGEIFRDGYIKAPLILLIATYLAFSIPDFFVGMRAFEIPFYLSVLFVLLFITYAIACFVDKKIKVKK